MMHITAIVLTAGFSSRMKQFKLGLPFKTHTIIEEVLLQLSTTSITETILVTGHYKARIEKVLAKNTRIKIVHNPDYAKGMTTSIQRGIHEAAEHTKGYLICLGDLPFITSEDYNEILSKIESVYDGNPCIVRPFFNNVPGNPVFFSTHYKKVLLNLTYMEGAKPLIKKYKDQMHKVLLKNNHIIRDIDTPDDYKMYLKNK